MFRMHYSIAHRVSCSWGLCYLIIIIKHQTNRLFALTLDHSGELWCLPRRSHLPERGLKNHMPTSIQAPILHPHLGIKHVLVPAPRHSTAIPFLQYSAPYFLLPLLSFSLWDGVGVCALVWTEETFKRIVALCRAKNGDLELVTSLRTSPASAALNTHIF